MRVDFVGVDFMGVDLVGGHPYMFLAGVLHLCEAANYKTITTLYTHLSSRACCSDWSRNWSHTIFLDTAEHCDAVRKRGKFKDCSR